MSKVVVAMESPLTRSFLAPTVRAQLSTLYFLLGYSIYPRELIVD